MADRAGAPYATALSVQRRRRIRRHGARPHPLDDLARDRRRARARREGHREVDHGPRARLGAAADRRHRRRPVLHAIRASPTRCRPTARSPPTSTSRPGPYASSSCRSAQPRTACSARCTSRRRCPTAIAEYEPGLLARAHRGILYVDEVNLLHDHLVDLLLDAAAMGRSTVERDGVSVEHAARFVLVGTMNPEEGELRPQLLDRFGLTVEVAAPRDPSPRAEVVRRRLAYEADPDAFAATYAEDEATLTDRIRPRAEAASTRSSSATRRCSRSPRSAPRSRSTACAPTSSRPAPPRARRVERAYARRCARTSAPRPGSRCPTAAGATRSTRPASTRTCSTRSSATTSRTPEPEGDGTDDASPTSPDPESERPPNRADPAESDELQDDAACRLQLVTAQPRRAEQPPRPGYEPRSRSRLRSSPIGPGCSRSAAPAPGESGKRSRRDHRDRPAHRRRTAYGPGRLDPSDGDDPRGGAAPARPRPHRQPAVPRRRPAPRGQARATSPTWSCSASTRQARWRRASAWSRSRPRSCRC